MPEDHDSFHSICSDPHVMKYVGDGQPWSPQKTREFIERASATSATCGFGQWALIRSDDSKLLGFCGFVDSDEGPEIGWRLAADSWGRGLATEAARAALKHAFDVLEFRRVIATVQAANRASIRVVEKLGMQPERSYQRNGREIIVFAVENRGQQWK